MSHRDVDLAHLSAGVVTPVADEQERRAEVSLRPGTLDAFVGQRELVRHLEICLLYTSRPRSRRHRQVARATFLRGGHLDPGGRVARHAVGR